MRQFKTDIIIFLGLAGIGVIALLLTAGQSTVDIQLYDTYFVIDKISMTVLIIGPLTFSTFLARALTRNFKARGSNIGLMIGLVLVAIITFYIIRLQQSHLSEIMRPDHEGTSDRGQFIADAKSRINWTWGLFGFWAMGLLLLTLRTIKIWREGYTG